MEQHPLLVRVCDEVDRFVAGGNFWPLWRATMAAVDAPLRDAGYSAEVVAWHDEVYDLVYMGQEGSPVSDDDDRVALIGEEELRARLRPYALRAPHRPTA